MISVNTDGMPAPAGANKILNSCNSQQGLEPCPLNHCGLGPSLLRH
jgi:hypothetical protein